MVAKCILKRKKLISFLFIAFIFNSIFVYLFFINSSSTNISNLTINPPISLIKSSGVAPPQIESNTTTKRQFLSYSINVNMPSYSPDGDLYI
ncbi:MAG: hypothetical protein ACFE8E_12425, partial [Candidatus Hodarchaeota archaeon]